MGGAFEIWQDPETQARFCFSHTGKDMTAGVLILKSNTELPKHERPLAFENLLQVSGESRLALLDRHGELQTSYTLSPGTSIHLQKGQWHIHSNPYEEESITLFKAEGDISQAVAALRETFTRIEPVDIEGQA